MSQPIPLFAAPDLQAIIARKKAEEALGIAQRDGDRIREECRTLLGFIRHAWPILEPVHPLKVGWAIEAMGDHLTAVTMGHITRLLMNVPPGLMKSLMTGVFWPAWEWGPKALASNSIIGTAHSLDIALRDNRKMRTLVESPWYQELWGAGSPSAGVIPAKPWAEDEFHNMARGLRKCMAFAGLTGGRADRVIVDDPLSTEGAESAADLATAERITRESLHTRVNDPEKSAIVMIMQRLHQKDPSGIILELTEENYVHLMLPMEFEPERRCVTRIGFQDPRTVRNELLMPERYPASVVAKLKQTLRAYGTAGQMQQRPAPRDGGMFKRSWFKPRLGLPPGCTFVRAWDFAGTEKAQGKGGSDPDWTVGLLMALTPDGEFIICDVIREQLTPGAVEKLVKATADADQIIWGPTRIRIPQDPAQAGKAQVGTYTKKLAGHILKAKPVSGDKILRAGPAASQAENGNLYMLRFTPPGAETADPRDHWHETFLDELTVFPASAHKDQTDALSDAVDELALPEMKGQAFWEIAQRELLAMKSEEAKATAATTTADGGVLAPGSVEWMMAQRAQMTTAAE